VRRTRVDPDPLLFAADDHSENANPRGGGRCGSTADATLERVPPRSALAGIPNVADGRCRVRSPVDRMRRGTARDLALAHSHRSEPDPERGKDDRSRGCGPARWRSVGGWPMTSEVAHV
jgi:hypothetical protein